MTDRYLYYLNEMKSSELKKQNRLLVFFSSLLHWTHAHTLHHVLDRIENRDVYHVFRNLFFLFRLKCKHLLIMINSCVWFESIKRLGRCLILLISDVKRWFIRIQSHSVSSLWCKSIKITFLNMYCLNKHTVCYNPTPCSLKCVKST